MTVTIWQQINWKSLILARHWPNELDIGGGTYRNFEWHLTLDQCAMRFGVLTGEYDRFCRITNLNGGFAGKLHA